MKQYIVDAFTDKPFTGNPAAVCVLDEWLPDDIMKKMAMENNFSETAFVVKEGDMYHIRWFTPTMEVTLCGHATLATTYVLGEFYDKAKMFKYKSLSGELVASKNENEITLDFPIYEHTEIAIDNSFIDILGGIKPEKAYTSVDYIFVLNKEEDVINFKPDFKKIASLDKKMEGMIITARSSQYDFVSRGFWPNEGIDEDPVTGAAHSSLFPLWGKLLNKDKMTAKQVSARGGEVKGELRNGRVYMTGKARLYSESNIFLV